MSSRLREPILPFYSTIVNGKCVQSWAPSTIKMWACYSGPRGGPQIWSENCSTSPSKKILGELELFILEKKRLQGDLTAAFISYGKLIRINWETWARTDKMKSSGLRIKEGSFRIEVSKNVFTMRVVGQEKNCLEKLWMPYSWKCSRPHMVDLCGDLEIAFPPPSLLSSGLKSRGTVAVYLEVLPSRLLTIFIVLLWKLSSNFKSFSYYGNKTCIHGLRWGHTAQSRDRQSLSLPCGSAGSDESQGILVLWATRHTAGSDSTCLMQNSQIHFQGGILQCFSWSSKSTASYILP